MSYRKNTNNGKMKQSLSRLRGPSLLGREARIRPSGRRAVCLLVGVARLEIL
ncbi:unnamed protein product [Brassica rapa]|uniref:Uncharacterized protein n=1 Tax=Brassica campestris TaxID=3711 RepID=A0A3P6BLT3_BRACM|nr:unnamed protein product [Brassica rapa]VDD06513.1 unnamed protein product [Brassica rapa]